MDDEDLQLLLHNKLWATFPDMAMIVYRPPGDLILSRPCIVYEPVQHEPSFANNNAYVVGMRYTVTLLSDLPGYPNPKKVYGIEGVHVTSSRSHITADIVHNVYTVSINTI